MSILSLRDFYNTVKDNGLRTNHEFQIEFGGLPVRAADMDKFVVYAQSAGLPGRTIEAQPTPYYGFNFQVPTNTTYEQTWELVVRLDKNVEIRTIFEEWFDYIASLKNSTGGKKGLIPSGSYALVHLLSPEFFNNNSAAISKSYRLEGVFPSSLGALTLDHSDNSISTFTMTLMFQYWYQSDRNGTNSNDPMR